MARGLDYRSADDAAEMLNTLPGITLEDLTGALINALRRIGTLERRVDQLRTPSQIQAQHEADIAAADLAAEKLPRDEDYAADTTAPGFPPARGLESETMAEQVGKPGIAILDRGWIYYGEITIMSDGGAEWCVIERALNIRRWGTTRGLGQLAAHGPQSDTVLDPAGTVRAPLRAVIAILDAEGSPWIAS